MLLAGRQGAAWCDAAGAAAGQFDGLELDIHRVGTAALGDPEARFAPAYGLSPSGAVLVRPDGFIAWRAAAMEQDPGMVLTGTLSALLSK